MGKEFTSFVSLSGNIVKPLALPDTPSWNHMVILEEGSINDYKTKEGYLGMC